MELLGVLLIFIAIPIGLFFIVRQKFRQVRDTAGMLKDAGQEMYERGTRMSGLIQKSDDPVEGIVDSRMATVGLAALVLSCEGSLSKADWSALHDVVMAQYRTGEAQAGDYIMLSQWLVGKLGDADIPRLAARATLLGGPDVAGDLEAIVSRSAEATGRAPGPALDAARTALNRA